jgi:hypothetical protein
MIPRRRWLPLLQLRLNLRCCFEEAALPALRCMVDGGRVEIGALHLSYEAPPPPPACPVEFANSIVQLVTDWDHWEEASRPRLSLLLLLLLLQQLPRRLVAAAGAIVLAPTPPHAHALLADCPAPAAVDGHAIQRHWPPAAAIPRRPLGQAAGAAPARTQQPR